MCYITYRAVFQLRFANINTHENNKIILPLIINNTVNKAKKIKKKKISITLTLFIFKLT